MYFKILQFINRVINFLRPKPRYMPLSISDVIHHTESKDLVDRFNDLYYSGGAAGDLNWDGAPMIKNPCDIWMIVELFQKIRPSVVIETGTHHGASASFYADILNSLKINCEVITVDINPKWHFDPKLKKIHSIIGYSTDVNVFSKIKEIKENILIKNPGNVMVLLDSDHSEKNVLAELDLYSSLVNKGSYIIVEDTNVNGHPSAPSHGPGPKEATDKFLHKNNSFERDLSCQKFLLTFNPGGWLKRIK
jgi:cephalosporin hydroxylase